MALVLAPFAVPMAGAGVFRNHAWPSKARRRTDQQTPRTHRSGWQQEWFDHVLRSNESLEEKVAYICNNPVRAGLVSEPESIPLAVEIKCRDGSLIRPAERARPASFKRTTRNLRPSGPGRVKRPVPTRFTMGNQLQYASAVVHHVHFARAVLSERTDGAAGAEQKGAGPGVGGGFGQAPDFSGKVAEDVSVGETGNRSALVNISPMMAFPLGVRVLGDGQNLVGHVASAGRV